MGCATRSNRRIGARRSKASPPALTPHPTLGPSPSRGGMRRSGRYRVHSTIVHRSSFVPQTPPRRLPPLDGACDAFRRTTHAGGMRRAEQGHEAYGRMAGRRRGVRNALEPSARSSNGNCRELVPCPIRLGSSLRFLHVEPATFLLQSGPGRPYRPILQPIRINDLPPIPACQDHAILDVSVEDKNSPQTPPRSSSATSASSSRSLIPICLRCRAVSRT